MASRNSLLEDLLVFLYNPTVQGKLGLKVKFDIVNLKDRDYIPSYNQDNNINIENTRSRETLTLTINDFLNKFYNTEFQRNINLTIHREPGYTYDINKLMLLLSDYVEGDVESTLGGYILHVPLHTPRDGRRRNAAIQVKNSIGQIMGPRVEDILNTYRSLIDDVYEEDMNMLIRGFGGGSSSLGLHSDQELNVQDRFSVSFGKAVQNRSPSPAFSKIRKSTRQDRHRRLRTPNLKSMSPREAALYERKRDRARSRSRSLRRNRYSSRSSSSSRSPSFPPGDIVAKNIATWTDVRTSTLPEGVAKEFSMFKNLIFPSS